MVGTRPCDALQVVLRELATFHCKSELLGLCLIIQPIWKGEGGIFDVLRGFGSALGPAARLSRSGTSERPPDVDEIVRQYAEPDLAPDSFHATVAAASQSVTAH